MLLRPRHALLALVVLLGTTGAAAWAQPRPVLSITLPSPEQVTKVGPAVVASHMLAGRKLQELLSSGFPARLHFAVELWSVGGWVNDLERVTEWDVVVRWIALENVYEVTQIAGDRPFSLGKFALLSDAEAAVGRPVRASIVAFAGRKRFYYLAALAVESLSISDLDEVERWLRGELRPAVRGERNPGTVLGRGVKTLASRLLGGERREYQQRTKVFETRDERR
jgi:hypothetical protein